MLIVDAFKLEPEVRARSDDSGSFCGMENFRAANDRHA